MEFLYDYLAFLAKTATIVASVIVVIIAIAGISMRKQHQPATGHIEIERVNDRIDTMRDALTQASLEPQAFKKVAKLEAKAKKQKKKQEEKQKQKQEKKQASKQQVDQAADEADGHRGRIFVLDFRGDIQASRVENLRQEITAVLTSAAEKDEVVVKVESAGGLVHTYGLAASQLARIRAKGIKLIACVDQVAASGGYLMAAVADRVLAAPFAVVGSIGVVAQVPNVHKLLKKHDVDVEVLTAGQYKRTLTIFGENTEEGREKFKQELEDTHALFQEYVSETRPNLDMASVATGEAWYGRRALERGLIDEIGTSDQYLADACQDKDVMTIKWVVQRKPIEKLMDQLSEAASSVLSRVVGGLK